MSCAKNPALSKVPCLLSEGSRSIRSALNASPIARNTAFLIYAFLIRLTLPSSVTIPLTARVIGAPQMILPPVSSIFVLHFPLGPGEFQAYPFPDVVFPRLLLSALSSSLFHCALQDGFGQT